MLLKKQAIKIKISLRRIYIYYKQLLHIIHIMNMFEKTTYILVNTQFKLSNILFENITDFFLASNLEYKYFKFNLNIYMYLIKNNFFKFFKISNFFIFFNFNYILQIPVKMSIKYLILFNNLLGLNTNNIQFFYIKLTYYEKIISLLFYKEFLEKIHFNKVHFKNVRLLVFYKLNLVRILFFNIYIKNVTNNLSIS